MLFEKAIKESLGITLDQLTEYSSKDSTYCFELCSPYNRIVVSYPNTSVALLAVRNNLSGAEIDPKLSDMADVPHLSFPKEYKFNSTPELIEWVSSQDPTQHEGTVVRFIKDGQFNRVKVKSPAYTAYNRLHDSLGSSDRNIMEIILLEKDDDVYPMMVPEIQEKMVAMKSGLVVAVRQYDAIFESLSGKAKKLFPENKFQSLSQRKKIFAQMVLGNKELWGAPLFRLYDGKCLNMMEFIYKNKKDGSWSAGFLDQMLALAATGAQDAGF